MKLNLLPSTLWRYDRRLRCLRPEAPATCSQLIVVTSGVTPNAMEVWPRGRAASSYGSETFRYGLVRTFSVGLRPRGMLGRV
jgi:hypothetical protein